MGKSDLIDKDAVRSLPDAAVADSGTMEVALSIRPEDAPDLLTFSDRYAQIVCLFLPISVRPTQPS